MSTPDITSWDESAHGSVNVKAMIVANGGRFESFALDARASTLLGYHFRGWRGLWRVDGVYLFPVFRTDATVERIFEMVIISSILLALVIV